MAPLFTGLKLGFGGGGGGGAPKSIVQTILSYTGNYSNLGPFSPSSTPVSIPANTTNVIIECIGGGGNNSAGTWGGRSQATFTTLAGKTLIATFTGYGAGAPGGVFGGSPYLNGHNYAGVFDGSVSQANSLVIGGGSGGLANGVPTTTPSNNITTGPTGAGNGGGGNQNGVDGTRGSRNDTQTTPAASIGKGGTTTAGGAGGSAAEPRGGAGGSGSALQGGVGGINNPAADYIGGQGGGGGYYGGGGGGGGWTGPGQPASTPLAASSGGGGGSGYIHPAGTSTISETGSPSGTPAGGSITITITELI